MIERKAVKVFHLVILEGPVQERKPRITASYLKKENAISDMNWLKDRQQCSVIEDVCYHPRGTERIVFEDGELPGHPPGDDEFSTLEIELINNVKDLFTEWRKDNPLKDEDYFSDEVLCRCTAQAYHEIEIIDPVFRSKDLPQLQPIVTTQGKEVQ